MQDRIIGVLHKSQQVYLRELGFYTGEIDGIWGQKSHEAMKLWVESPKFGPANKKRGTGPIIPFERLPKGYSWGVLDGQRCVVKKNSLPQSFVMQELVNLMTQPAKKAKVSQNPQTTNVASVKQENLVVEPLAAEEAKTDNSVINPQQQNTANSILPNQNMKHQNGGNRR